MKCRLEFLTKFSNLYYSTVVTITDFWLNSRLKKAIWYMALPNETILRGRTIISTKHQPNKKIGVNKTANSKSGFKTGHLSKYE